MSRLASLLGRLSATSARFSNERGGNVAVLFGLAVIPLAGLVGLALDYNRATEFRTLLLREADGAALSIASADAPNTDSVLAAVKERLTNYYGTNSGMVSDITTSSSWVGGTIVTVTLAANLQTTISGMLPGASRNLALTAQSSAKRKPAEWQWSLPTVKDLSYEAGDYNRISVYCYDESKKAESNKGRRLETLVAISDNGGTDYSKAKMPSCNAGETLSYQLRNVRNSRTTPANWDKASAEHYLYYTDTKMDPNTLVMTNTVTGGREATNGTMTLTDLTNAPILETILCDTLTNCKMKSAGGILPNNNQTNRTPAVATGACANGKSMYYGWEDRPPTSAGASDRDYDDIRIVVTCPTLVKISDKEVRIVK
jgi:Flp pilus assembly protein TadG